MGVLVPIGDFSRMTYLTVKALRHYHDLGLLEPTEVDPSSGYRLYSTAEVPTALLISRFRDLEMPLDDVREMLQAKDLLTRNQIILAHLERMEDRLAKTQTTVASLKLLLDVSVPISVEFRFVEPTQCFAIREHVSADDCETWLAAAYAELDAAMDIVGCAALGASGALYSDEFFSMSAGEVVAFTPTSGIAPSDSRARSLTLPESSFAVTVHEGPFDGIDRTYAALGTYVAERRLGAPGPVREVYAIVDDHHPANQRTEVCWPIIPAPPATAPAIPSTTPRSGARS